MLECSSLLNGGGLKLAEMRFSCRLYVPQTVCVKNLRKTPIAKQVTALPIFENPLDISTHTCVYDSILQGQNLPDLERDHFSLRTPLHDLSAVFF